MARDPARAKAWRETNRERLKAVNKAWYESNREKKKAWYESNREKRKAYQLKRRYNISPEDRDKMLEAQGGKCAVCKISFKDIKSKWDPVKVDHCYKTKKVRDLLCNFCNIFLGSLEKHEARAIELQAYRDRWAQKHAEEDQSSEVTI